MVSAEGHGHETQTCYRRVVLVLSFATPAMAEVTEPWRQMYREADDAFFALYRKGGHATALQRVRPLAERDNMVAQYYSGLLYASGKGAPRDLDKAAKCMRKAVAALPGYVNAESCLKAEAEPIKSEKGLRKAARSSVILALKHL